VLPPAIVNTTSSTPIAGLNDYLLPTPIGSRIYSFQGFLAILLPYIEQANVLTQGSGGYNLHLDFDDPQNRPASSTRIPIYECPSSPSGHVVTPNGGFEPAVGDYMAVTRANSNAAVWQAYGYTFPVNDDNSGVLMANKRTLITTIPDGLSNTLMMGESAARHEGWLEGKFYQDIATTPPPCGTWGVRGAWAQSSNNIVCAGTKKRATSDPPPIGTCPAKVANAADVTAGTIAVNGWNQGELYSFHSGVCVIGMGDGSVRTLKDTLDLSVLIRMAARGDGNPYTLD